MPVNTALICDKDYTLATPQNETEWQAYHDIRREELFEARGRHGIYDANRPEEHKEGHHSLLLKFKGTPIGTVRLDAYANETKQNQQVQQEQELTRPTTYIVRLVAIKAPLQGQGHGKALDQLMLEYARNLGAVQLLVNADSQAYGYYQKTGWTDHHWSQNEIDAAFEPIIQMQKFINLENSISNEYCA